MTVLAASIVTRAGKPLVSRQFTGFSRARIESLLLSFTKLIPTNVQHTTLLSSDGTIRYVYMPVDDLYVLLLTPPSSNIIADLDTLQLLTRIVAETCASALGGRGGASESEVLRNSFELLSSFDEVVSLGYREKVGIGEVRAAMEMESHEERIQDIIARNKEMEAKEELKRRAKQLEMQRKDMLRRGQDPYSSNNAGGGAGRFDSYQPPAQSQYDYTPPSAAPTQAPLQTKFKGKGMQLGAGKVSKTNDLIDALGGAPDEPMPTFSHHTPLQTSAAPSPVPVAAAPVASPTPVNPFGQVDKEDVHLVIRETFSLELARDGGLSGPVTIAGSLDLRLAAPEFAKLQIQLQHQGGSETQFKPHPNVDKQAWAKTSLVGLKDANKGFPVGQDVKVLRWRMQKKDDALVPLAINCWPSPSDKGMSVTIEYEADNDTLGLLKDVLVSIPLPPGAYPTIDSVAGSCDVNTETHTLDWAIPEIDPTDDDSKTGLLEFSIASADADAGAFFPIAVDFAAQKSCVDVDVLGVSLVGDSGEAVEYSLDRLCMAEDYLIA